MKLIPRQKRAIMTASEMDAMNAEIVEHNHLYSRDTDASEKVQSIVTSIGAEIITEHEKININDAEAVKNVVAAYIASCARTGVLPSKMGLSRALGYSRLGLDKYVKSHEGTASATFLQNCFDGFAEMLTMASLTGACHPIVGIFIEKAIYGLRENDALPEPPVTGVLSDADAAEIAQRYMDIPEE